MFRRGTYQNPGPLERTLWCHPHHNVGARHPGMWQVSHHNPRARGYGVKR